MRRPQIFLEVEVTDASEFHLGSRSPAFRSGGTESCAPPDPASRTPSLRSCCQSAISTTQVPHVYFEWSERAPGENVLRFLLAGEGDIPPLTHEILRKRRTRREPRPQVHVGG